MRGWLALWWIGQAACGGGAADHERLGDRHYRDARYIEAVAEYQAALRVRDRPEIQAKLGAAALEAGEAIVAVRAFEQLAVGDPTRTQEAARGIERAARMAGQGGTGGPAVTTALLALRRIAPDRPVTLLARGGRAMRLADQPEAVGLLPSAMASAGGGADVDRLLLEYADGLRTTTACEDAVRVYRTALRRLDERRARMRAREGLSVCALRLGLDALSAERPAVAERWLAEAVLVDSTTANGFEARLLWGDARLRQGDVLGAALAWQALLGQPAAPDSVVVRARERLNRLGAADAPAGQRDSLW